MLILKEATVERLQEAMRTGETTARQLVLGYLSRIARLDACPGGLNAVMELNADALFIAGELDAERARGHVRGPLHGVPVLLKDNICTKDGLHTSAGALALRHNYARRDAFIVTKLRQAGAVLLGKANMTELANYLSDHMPGGYSSRGGQTLCPYDRAADANGSSTGSAVAVSANLCALAVGTETCGSILCPAWRNGVVGIKPTLGLISRSGVLPISTTLDTAGPLARTVADAALLLGILAGEDGEDAATRCARGRRRTDYTRGLDGGGLKGLRVGLCGFTPVEEKDEPAGAARLRQALEAAGASVIDVDAPPLPPAGPIMREEFAGALSAHLAAYGGEAPHTLEELIAYNSAHAQSCLRYGQATALEALGRERRVSLKYLEALVERENCIQKANKWMDGFRLDLAAFLAPTPHPSLLGFPAIALPMGLSASTGLPLGVTLMARPFAEPTLLRAAFALEAQLAGRVPPKEETVDSPMTPNPLDSEYTGAYLF